MKYSQVSTNAERGQLLGLSHGKIYFLFLKTLSQDKISFNIP